jgi:hypothetical protein
MPALKSWRYVVTTEVAFGCGDAVLGWAFADPPQAASPPMRSTTRTLSRAKRFAVREKVDIVFLYLSAIVLVLLSS